MKPYTVLLLRPDYIADEFGKDTYMAHVMAPDVACAQKMAQNEAHGCDMKGNDEEDVYGEPADYAVLLVLPGRHNDVSVPQ